eukprot:m.70247 g.70247  ORF g.70247 m.70247 type:complete len:161 (-) comp14156_c0_seq31:708-1190(-)
MREEVSEETVANLSNRNPFKHAMLQAANAPATTTSHQGNSAARLLSKPVQKGSQTALSAKLLALTGPKPRLGRGLGQTRGRDRELSKAASLAASRMKQAAVAQPLHAKRPAAANITPSSNPEAAKKKKPIYSLKGDIITYYLGGDGFHRVISSGGVGRVT